jgi:hypothetical protein
MGTSQSKRDSRAGNPLIPPHADRDPLPGVPPAPPLDPVQGIPPLAHVAGVVPRGRLKAFRTSLGRYAASGDSGDARSALGHWARSAGGSARVARAVRSGGALFGALAGARAGQPGPGAAFDFRRLQGVPIGVAIDQIVDAFCPPGILDEDLARIAMGQALDEALQSQETFDANAVDDHAIGVAVLAFVAEMVFVSVMGDAGKALANAPTQLVAVQREADIRDLAKAVTDFVGTPIINRMQTQGRLVADAMSGVIAALVDAVQAEMRTWR